MTEADNSLSVSAWRRYLSYLLIILVAVAFTGRRFIFWQAVPLLPVASALFALVVYNYDFLWLAALAGYLWDMSLGVFFGTGIALTVIAAIGGFISRKLVRKLPYRLLAGFTFFYIFYWIGMAFLEKTAFAANISWHQILRLKAAAALDQLLPTAVAYLLLFGLLLLSLYGSKGLRRTAPHKYFYE